MAFNLVGKLIARNDVDAMRAAFEQAGAPWPGDDAVARFEVEDRKVFGERQKQPTSFDVVIDPPADRAAASLFVEVKLVEKEFGTCSRTSSQRDSPCSGDNPLQGPDRLESKCELARIGRLYWERLREQGLLTDAHRQARRCPMADHYQFYREAAFALHKGGYYVLLADARNPCFVSSASSAPTVDGADSGLWHRLRSGLPPEHRERLHFVSLQSVVAAIRATGRHSDWIEVFAAKYAIDVDVKKVAALQPVATVAAHLRTGVGQQV